MIAGRGRWDALIFSMVCSWVMVVQMRNLWIPKYSKPMRVLRGLIPYREVKKLINQEVYRKIVFPAGNRYGMPTILVSEHWISINSILMPKKMCLGVEVYSTDLAINHCQTALITIKGDYLKLEDIEQEYLESFLAILVEELPELIINPSYTHSLKQLKHEFYKNQEQKTEELFVRNEVTGQH